MNRKFFNTDSNAGCLRRRTNKKNASDLNMHEFKHSIERPRKMKTYPKQKVKGEHQIFDACVTATERHFLGITYPISSKNAQ